MSDSKLFKTIRLAIWTVISTINCLLCQCIFWMKRTVEVVIITKILAAMTQNLRRWFEAEEMLPTLENMSMN